MAGNGSIDDAPVFCIVTVLLIENAFGYPIRFRSHLSLNDTLDMIENISSAISILILQGENNSQTPVQQAFMLQ